MLDGAKPQWVKEHAEIPNTSLPTTTVPTPLAFSSHFVFWVYIYMNKNKQTNKKTLDFRNELFFNFSWHFFLGLSSPAEIFLFEKTKLSKILMRALAPRTVIMIPTIEQYSQRQAHFKIWWGKSKPVCALCMCLSVCI